MFLTPNHSWVPKLFLWLKGMSESFLQCRFQYRLQIVAMPTYWKLLSLLVNLNSGNWPESTCHRSNMFCQPTAWVFLPPVYCWGGTSLSSLLLGLPSPSYGDHEPKSFKWTSQIKFPPKFLILSSPSSLSVPVDFNWRLSQQLPQLQVFPKIHILEASECLVPPRWSSITHCSSAACTSQAPDGFIALGQPVE